jgi:hypothetical protein
MKLIKLLNEIGGKIIPVKSIPGGFLHFFLNGEKYVLSVSGDVVIINFGVLDKVTNKKAEDLYNFLKKWNINVEVNDIKGKVKFYIHKSNFKFPEQKINEIQGIQLLNLPQYLKEITETFINNNQEKDSWIEKIDGRPILGVENVKLWLDIKYDRSSKLPWVYYLHIGFNKWNTGPDWEDDWYTLDAMYKDWEGITIFIINKDDDVEENELHIYDMFYKSGIKVIV